MSRVKRTRLILFAACVAALALSAAASFAAAAARSRATPLNATAARNVAKAKARRFEVAEPRIGQVNFEGCERGSPHKIHCTFYGRGASRTMSRVCIIVAVVHGSGTRARATLKPTCKSIPRVLTFPRALAAIETAAEETPEGRLEAAPTISGLHRRGPRGFEATATWSQRTTELQACEATITAHLNLKDEVATITTPPSCHPAI
jgi:hypothetical protein